MLAGRAQLGHRASCLWLAPASGHDSRPGSVRGIGHRACVNSTRLYSAQCGAENRRSGWCPIGARGRYPHPLARWRTSMDGNRFDDLARRLAAVRSRRATTRLLGGGVLAALLAPWGLRDAAAKNRRHRGGRLVARWLDAIQARRATGRPQGGGAFMASLAAAGRSDTEAKRKHHKHKNKHQDKRKTARTSRKRSSRSVSVRQRAARARGSRTHRVSSTRIRAATTRAAARPTPAPRPRRRGRRRRYRRSAATTTTHDNDATPLSGAARGVREQWRVL